MVAYHSSERKGIANSQSITHAYHTTNTLVLLTLTSQVSALGRQKSTVVSVYSAHISFLCREALLSTRECVSCEPQAKSP